MILMIFMPNEVDSDPSGEIVPLINSIACDRQGVLDIATLMHYKVKNERQRARRVIRAVEYIDDAVAAFLLGPRCSEALTTLVGHQDRRDRPSIDVINFFTIPNAYKCRNSLQHTHFALTCMYVSSDRDCKDFESLREHQGMNIVPI